jgi:hypothetical protein
MGFSTDSQMPDSRPPTHLRRLASGKMKPIPVLEAFRRSAKKFDK